MVWLSYSIAAFLGWHSIASFIGAQRLRFRPLILQAIAYLAASIFLAISAGDYPRSWLAALWALAVLSLLCIYIYEFRLQAGKQLLAKGITLRKLLLLQT
jgi:uncharacterized membrane protein